MKITKFFSIFLFFLKLFIGIIIGLVISGGVVYAAGVFISSDISFNSKAE